VSESIKGRGAAFNPPNRFEKLHLEPLDIERDLEDEIRPVPTIFYKDTSRTILAKNDSPDIPFSYSINPYRGCEHGCIYCYARPSHELLGFSAGIDFETKIMVKLDAPKLLAEAFRKKTWKPQMVCLSGNTDCYQPAERKLQITRQCLEVFLRHRNPVGIVTKNFLVTRDLDILNELAALNLVVVSLSITSLHAELIRVMEPRTSAPHKRLEAVEILASAGVPVDINLTPIIPGLNDEEIPTILRESAARGATSASFAMLRLPGFVQDLFLDWLRRELPDRSTKILNRIKDMRGGALHDSRWHSRIRGEGEITKTIGELFRLTCEKYGLNKKNFEFSLNHFRRLPQGQEELFG